jgi:hypothetical protein
MSLVIGLDLPFSNIELERNMGESMEGNGIEAYITNDETSG